MRFGSVGKESVGETPVVNPCWAPEVVVGTELNLKLFFLLRIKNA